MSEPAESRHPFQNFIQPMFDKCVEIMKREGMFVDEKELRDAFEKYKHPHWGVVGRYPAQGESKEVFSCDNYHLLTAVYFRILRSWGFQPSSKELEDYEKFLMNCLLVVNGLRLYTRFPGRNTDISEDEIYGICYLSSIGTHYLSEWGENHFWNYTISPLGSWKLKYFFGRFPCFTAYLKTASRSFAWLWPLYWVVGFVASALTSFSESSGKQESYVQIPVMEKSFLGKFGIKLWRFIMSKRYPKGYRQVATIWASDHPMAKFARTDWAN